MKNIAHRGYSGKYPENTMLAFRKAIEVGSDMIELDITLSKDKIPVVIHDDTLDRTTNGNGKVRKANLNQLKQLDAGSWRNTKFKNEKIPTLEEVLMLIKKSKIELNIEIKSTAHDRNFSDSCIEVLTLALMQKFRLLNRIVISSFEPKVLERLRKLSPKIKLSYLIESQPKIPRVNPISFVNKIGAYSLNMHMSQVGGKIFLEARKHRIPVYAFTVNKINEMRKMQRLGVGGIFTNYPEKLLKKITL